MKTIGIKLADGTFYPVLEEGTPKQRMLDLTTAKDNQTKVQIDLYRSETGTMDDAEYVDTLEVTKLNPHPNGEPELHLSVGLDEDNKLTAEVVDPETGKKSETEVTLISRTEAERASPADFAITNQDSASGLGIVAEDAASDKIEDSTFSPDDLPDIKSDVLEDMPFSFDHSEPHVTSELSPASQGEKTETSDFDGELPDFSDLDNDLPIEDTTLESVDFSNKDFSDNDDFDSLVGTESPDLDDKTEIQGDSSSIDDDSTILSDTLDIPDFDATVSDSNDNIDDFSTKDYSIPDFDDTSSDSIDSADPTEFDLPDFDSLTSDKNSFDSNEFNSTLDNLNSEPEDKFFDDLSTGSTAGSAMDFSDLYDKETIAGEHASIYDEEDEHKKTRVPVIICIICAIICVIATILVLFVVPSKYNLIASRNTNGVSILDRFFSKEETAIEKPVEEKPAATTTVIDVKPEDKKSEPAPQAVEDKIVIAPEPEKVVPVTPPPAPVEEKKPAATKKRTSDVKYHIRWGDTLWDISESYYKTPWKYPKIADYNGIKNPDLIISGKDILIPAE